MKDKIHFNLQIQKEYIIYFPPYLLYLHILEQVFQMALKQIVPTRSPITAIFLHRIGGV